VGFGETLDITKARYGRVILMADADVDGSHIRTLLLTFLWRYLRPLVDNGYIFLAQPPLYLVKKGKVQEYAFNDEDRDKLIKKLAPDGKVDVQRYKGLGEMNPEQLWETTMDPARRTLLRITVDDALEADDIFTRLMGTEVEPRRRFIQAHAKAVRNLDV
jgi:DNA gyrase subunit B